VKPENIPATSKLCLALKQSSYILTVCNYHQINTQITTEMSLPQLENTETIVKKRFLGFLIWESIHSTAVFFLSKTLLLSPFTPTPFRPSFLTLLAFVAFHLSLLLFSTVVSIVATPQSHRPASPLELVVATVKFVFVPGGPPFSLDFRRKARITLCFVLFVTASALSGFVSVVSVCWSCYSSPDLQVMSLLFGTFGFRAFVAGLFYGVHYVYRRRWILQFPIIQRRPFFSFKMGIPFAIKQALKLSNAGYLLSAVLAIFIPTEYKNQVSAPNFIVQQIIFYIGCFVVFFCWELSHHLHQILHTKRFKFAPSKGSAAAETNPSEPLLAALEESPPKSLLQNLAYLDLCMVCENNVDTWRRAAFFEETGDTYKRVVSICLRPLEQLTSKLSEGLESSSPQDSVQLSHQLRSPTEKVVDSSLYELLNDFQLYAWSARSVASLTVHSHKEDRFGVAQLSGSNAAIISTLLSSLIAVETLLGKKTNMQSPNSLMGPAVIKWAALNNGRRDPVVAATGKRKDSPMYSKAYVVADILKTSIYCIVSAFHDEMLNTSNSQLLEKDWIVTTKPLHGTHELLVQKLRLFLDFRAS
jgi:nucleoporin NDC1